MPVHLLHAYKSSVAVVWRSFIYGEKLKTTFCQKDKSAELHTSTNLDAPSTSCHPDQPQVNPVELSCSIYLDTPSLTHYPDLPKENPAKLPTSINFDIPSSSTHPDSSQNIYDKHPFSLNLILLSNNQQEFLPNDDRFQSGSNGYK